MNKFVINTNKLQGKRLNPAQVEAIEEIIRNDPVFITMPSDFHLPIYPGLTKAEIITEIIKSGPILLPLPGCC